MNQHTKRLAVVLGNSDYINLTPLLNPINDAMAVKEALQSLGYEVSLGINLQRNEILQHFTSIIDSWKHKAKEIVVYYSGHGISIGGKAYIASADSDGVSEDLIRESYLSVETIIKLLLKHRKNAQYPVILILDCCRSKVLSDSTRGCDPKELLRNTEGEPGTESNIAILYSTAYGEVAQDGGDGGNHSPYTKILLENIVKDLDIFQINSVITNTLSVYGKQMSWMTQCLHEPYRFKLKVNSQELLQASFISKDIDIPYFYGVPPKNQNFVNRPEIISRMENFITKKPFIDGGNILALNGLGGMGKTQLMLQYCYLHHHEYNYTFWLEADGRMVTLESFQKLACNLGLDKAVMEEYYKDEKIIDFVCSWLQNKTKPKWLLLLNNVDKVITDLLDRLPRIGGDIILTTREDILSTKARLVSVRKMNENEALSLLLNSQTLDSIDHQDEGYGKKIVIELDSMPLAISLARAYIDNTQISFKNYLYILKNQRGKLFLHENQDNSQYNHNLTTVWKLSFERIRDLNPLARLILDICAFLQPEAIPVSFFEKQFISLGGGPVLPLSSSGLEDNPVRTAIAVLVKFSFVTITLKEEEDEEDYFLSIHRLVQESIFNEMDDDQKIRLAYDISKALNNEIEFSDTYAATTRKIMNTYLSHIQHFITLLHGLKQNLLLSTDLEDLLMQTVDYLLENGIYIGVETLAEFALSISKFIHGEHSPSVAQPLTLLAMLFQNRGIYARAEPLYEQALTIVKTALGPEDQNTATSMNNLALLYFNQSKYSDAEQLYKEALEITEKILGSDHPDMAISQNNLASLYKTQGKYADAGRLYLQALTIKEKAFGSEHPDIAISKSNLASLYKKQGNYTDAELLYREALEINEKVLGPKHTRTATSLNNLASLYKNQGKYADAVPLYQRALIIMGKAFGSEHSGVVISLNNLASIYCNQGKYADAEPLYQQALIIKEKVFGSKHLETAISLGNLASLYFKQGKYADAKPLYQRALEINEKVLGPTHPDTKISLENLEYNKKAKERRDWVPIIREEELDPDHPDVVDSMNALVLVHKKPMSMSI